MEKSKISSIAQGNIFEVEAISFFSSRRKIHARGGNIFIGTIAVDVRGSFEFAVAGSTDGIMGRSSVLIDSRELRGKIRGKNSKKIFQSIDRTTFSSLFL